jgi:hypothetical protein
VKTVTWDSPLFTYLGPVDRFLDLHGVVTADTLLTPTKNPPRAGKRVAPGAPQKCTLGKRRFSRARAVRVLRRRLTFCT